MTNNPAPIRIGMIATLAALAGAIGCGSPDSEEAAVAEPRPNIIIVMIDTLRFDHIEPGGHDRPTSPFLARLANEGTFFENAWAQAPHTLASTATFLTGRYFPPMLANRFFEPVPGLNETRQRVMEEVRTLAEENNTLAEVFSDAGFETFAVFTNPHHHPTSGFFQGFDSAEFIPGIPEPEEAADGAGINDRFSAWLDARSGSDNGERKNSAEADAEGKAGRPFFAYLHYMEPHHPYRPPPELEAQFVTEAGEYKYTNGTPQGAQVPSPEDLEYMKGLYDAEIRYNDSLLEELWASLEARGLAENTILVVTSDHGEEFMDHGGMGHGITLEIEMLHIPLIIYTGPGKANSRSDRLVRNLDVAATVLDFARIPLPENYDGASLAPLIHGSPGGPPDEDHESGPKPSFSFARNNVWRSVTTERWHLIRNMADDTRTLYDLEADPGGTVDVMSRNPKIAAELDAIIDTMNERYFESGEIVKTLEAIHAADAEPGAEMDPGLIRQLEALGYLRK